MLISRWSSCASASSSVSPDSTRRSSASCFCAEDARFLISRPAICVSVASSFSFAMTSGCFSR
ncbi:MAG: hypothetical protein H6745_17430 [Deltaproteobacteria bacterium]|nr:hypothetical protein [Deltaproteobacteria bacterium]